MSASRSSAHTSAPRDGWWSDRRLHRVRSSWAEGPNVHRRTLRAGRAKSELGEERACFIDGCPATWKTLPHPEGRVSERGRNTTVDLPGFKRFSESSMPLGQYNLETRTCYKSSPSRQRPLPVDEDRSRHDQGLRGHAHDPTPPLHPDRTRDHRRSASRRQALRSRRPIAAAERAGFYQTTVNATEPPGYGFSFQTCMLTTNFGSSMTKLLDQPFRRPRLCWFRYTRVTGEEPPAAAARHRRRALPSGSPRQERRSALQARCRRQSSDNPIRPRRDDKPSPCQQAPVADPTINRK